MFGCWLRLPGAAVGPRFLKFLTFAEKIKLTKLQIALLSVSLGHILAWRRDASVGGQQAARQKVEGETAEV